MKLSRKEKFNDFEIKFIEIIANTISGGVKAIALNFFFK